MAVRWLVCLAVFSFLLSAERPGLSIAHSFVRPPGLLRLSSRRCRPSTAARGRQLSDSTRGAKVTGRVR